MNYYEWFAKIIYTLDDVLWSTPFIIFVLVVGVYFFVKSKGFSIVHLPHIFKYTLGNVLKKSSDKTELKKKKGTVSPFELFALLLVDVSVAVI